MPGRCRPQAAEAPKPQARSFRVLQSPFDAPPPGRAGGIPGITCESS